MTGEFAPRAVTRTGVLRVLWTLLLPCCGSDVSADEGDGGDSRATGPGATDAAPDSAADAAPDSARDANAPSVDTSTPPDGPSFTAACDFRGTWQVPDETEFADTEFSIGGDIGRQVLDGPAALLETGCCGTSEAHVDEALCSLTVYLTSSLEDDIECMGQAYLIRVVSPTRPVPSELPGELVGTWNHESFCASVDESSPVRPIVVRRTP